MLTLDEVKTTLGIIGPTYDSSISTLIPVVTGWMESACNRGLEFKAEEHQTFESVSNVLHLYRFPIVEVYSVTVNGTALLNSFEVDKRKGTLISKSGFSCRFNNLQVTYDAGYQTVPADLALAFSSIIGDQIGVAPPATSGGSGGSTGASAPLKSLSLGSGALSVAFATSTSSVTTGGIVGGYEVENYQPELQNYAGTLNRYRVEALPI
jgi:hypothetical protein